MRPGRLGLVGVGLAVGAAGLIAEAAALPAVGWGRGLSDLATGWLLWACGLVAAKMRPGAATGPLLGLAGLAWFCGTFADARIGALAAVGAALLTLHRGALIHAVLGYPRGRMHLGERVVVGVAWLGAAIVSVARDERFTLLLCGLVVGAAVARWRREVGPERRSRLVALGAATTLAAVLGAGAVARLAGLDTSGGGALLAYEFAVAFVALGLLLDVLWGGPTEVAVAELVITLGRGGDAGTLRDRLARAIGDPSLVVAYRVPGAAVYVDDAGSHVQLPAPGGARAVTFVEQDGRALVALVHDATVLGDRALLDGVAAAARLALRNWLLQAEARGQAQAIRLSSRRIVDAQDAQRRRLAGELRVGVDPRLARARAHLERAGSTMDRDGALLLGESWAEVERGRRDLRELAHGVHPAVLIDGGLAVAVREAAGRCPVAVEVSVDCSRPPGRLELAAYYVCVEALTNVAKHAGASRVTVIAYEESNQLVVEVTDDGAGGADVTRGSGLRGLTDRVEAAGGRLRLDSPVGRGTRVVAELPYAEIGVT